MMRLLAMLLCGMISISAVQIPVLAAENEGGGEPDYYAQAEERKNEEIQSDQIEGWPEGPKIGAEGAILMEAETGTILYAKNIHEHLYPASITKVLTGLLAYENLKMNDKVEFSETAVYSIEFGSSSIGIDPGEALTVEQSLYALFVASANEVAAGLAEKMGGSLDKFADMMNA
jgi:D-alanyl-D-alanine carboxypeptidase